MAEAREKLIRLFTRIRRSIALRICPELSYSASLDAMIRLGEHSHLRITEAEGVHFAGCYLDFSDEKPGAIVRVLPEGLL